MRRISVKTMFLLVEVGAAISMLALSFLLSNLTGQGWVLLAGALLTACALVWLFLLTLFFAKRLSQFTNDLCRTMDSMISGGQEPARAEDRETIFARISYRLSRLYNILQENRRKVDEERRELQTLVSDISHQVKTPVANLKMVTDTLLAKPVTEQERRDFLQGIRSQTDKLEFLVQSMGKASRLETGAVTLEKKDVPLLDTLAQAMSGIVYGAEQKGISVEVQCPDDLRVSHDSKWTAEALFNLLDNAVKYTPAGGKISVSVEQWEMYVKLDVADTGKGIPESQQAAIFRRFYRAEEVHDQPGVGIGLYLAREIVTRQGGYIKVTSKPGRGSTFSVFLPRR
ncbi:sensor histidine kinase [Acutalibacter sp. 1XD8-33]|uniref:sensor histidine kinase n=1 Tax=Acutalibacter sp. 1XD8-33 TaxID=2320081 RepID=UPI000EA37F91|nr:HAMP domain-containing sensor histidine kinase [Acutalibacter sp. 1XD8-33]RKJ39771.1 sensor histidine kinase [Acutalibacter sp. 1XD8-33]